MSGQQIIGSKKLSQGSHWKEIKEKKPRKFTPCPGQVTKMKWRK